MLAEKDRCPELLKESLRAYVDGRPTGNFLQAVLENNLGMALLRADEENKLLLPEIYAFVVDAVPSFARGSAKAVAEHLEKNAARRAETLERLDALEKNALKDPECSRCDGCGEIADSEDGEPWTHWMDLPPGSNLAVVAGIVKPIPCPECSPP